MTTLGPPLTRQIVVRVTDELHADLAADAAEHGRTVAQSARHLLRQSLGLIPAVMGQPRCAP